MKTLLSWKAPEFEKHKKGAWWFILFTIGAAGLLWIAIWWKAFTMIVFLILAIFLIIIYAFKEPRIINFSIGYSGIKIDKTLYKYSDINSFWIFYEPPEVKEISIKLKRAVFPYLSLPLGETDPSQARNILRKFLPEKKHKGSVAENIARTLKF